MSLRIGTIVGLFILGIILLGLSWTLWKVRETTKPLPGNCDTVKESQPGVLWNNTCSYIEEKDHDGTLKTPQKPLYLTRFTASSSFGPPLGANAWYRYRYVNGKTGGYSLFSPWTKSPVIAGGLDLPCKDGNCDGVSAGKSSCQNNIVQLGIDDLDYDIASGIYANVHRVVLPANNSKQPGKDEEGQIVGFLAPQGMKSWQFIDLSPSPCSDIICNRPGC